MSNHTEDVWCPVCGETFPITADIDSASAGIEIDAQWAAHICEIKGPGPRGFLAAGQSGSPEQ